MRRIYETCNEEITPGFIGWKHVGPTDPNNQHQAYPVDCDVCNFTLAVHKVDDLVLCTACLNEREMQRLLLENQNTTPLMTGDISVASQDN